jgi:hypothetical protein
MSQLRPLQGLKPRGGRKRADAAVGGGGGAADEAAAKSAAHEASSALLRAFSAISSCGIGHVFGFICLG